MHTTTSTISTKNPFLYFSQLSPPYSTLTIPSLQSSKTFLSSITQQFFTSFCVQTSQHSTPKLFSLPQSFSQFRLRQRTKELSSLVRNDTVLISPFFLKVWTMVTGLTITDSLSLRLIKLVYCR